MHAHIPLSKFYRECADNLFFFCSTTRAGVSVLTLADEYISSKLVTRFVTMAHHRPSADKAFKLTEPVYCLKPGSHLGLGRYN